MTAKELIEQLQKVAPDTGIIGGTLNQGDRFLIEFLIYGQ